MRSSSHCYSGLGVSFILKIAHIDAGQDFRGGQDLLLSLARGLKQRGHRQVIVCPEGSALAERAARVEAARAGVHVDLVQARIEDLPGDIGQFHAVTIGRALHWFDRDEALAVLDRIVAPHGWIAICGTRTFGAAMHGWNGTFHEIRRAWSSDPDESRYHIDFAEWFRGSRFRKVEDVEVTESQQVSISDLIGRALSMSTTSPEALGDRRPGFEAALHEALEPLATEGVFDEQITAVAMILR